MFADKFVNKFDLTFGTDPEFFILDSENKTVPIPYLIEDLGVPEIGYDESRKHPVIYRCENYKIMMDGVASEANPSPCKTAEEMHEKIQDVLNTLQGIINPFGYSVAVIPTVLYDYFKYFDENSRAKSWCGIFGCDPDRDAILENYNSPEIDVTTHPYRYGGGHFHVSDNNRIINKYPIPAIRLMAITLGNFSVANSPFPEEEKLRMFKYGQPGRFRVQNYPDGNIGVEYRSPSNVWVSNLESINGMMFWMNQAYELLNNQDKAIKVLDAFLNETVTAIQNVDQDHSKHILESVLKF